MTEIEIRDPDPLEPSLPGASPGDAAAVPGPESPYKNLLVPLVVVPALIVMVLVLVFVLFGAVAGEEDSPRQNLERVLNGGFGDRKQAAFNLVRQVLDYQRARHEGREVEWEIEASLLPELRAAREQVGDYEGAGDVVIPLVLSIVLAELGEPEGVDQLARFLELSGVNEPEPAYRLYAVMTLSGLGAKLDGPERELAARTLIRLLSDDDPDLVLFAIAGLQNLPTPETVPALQGMLSSGALEQRASAALSLATLADPAGRAVLIEMLDPASYEAERASDARRWPPRRVSESRCKALEALVALGAPPAEAELQALAEDDPDPALRSLAKGLLDGGAAR